MSQSTPVIGKCKLCLLERELRDSHFLPKSAYRILQRSENSPPIAVKSTVAMHTNQQVHDYILCQECEQRFDENGERWMMRNCYRASEGFKLKDLIDASQPVMGTKSEVYSAALIPQIDIEKLTYFVASIIWRSSAHDWRSGKDKVVRIYLGSYREELRRYLLGKTSFPQNAALVVNIIPDSNLWGYFSFPNGEKVNQCWQYRFHLLGLSFMFFLGGLIDPLMSGHIYKLASKLSLLS